MLELLGLEHQISQMVLQWSPPPPPPALQPAHQYSHLVKRAISNLLWPLISMEIEVFTSRNKWCFTDARVIITQLILNSVFQLPGLFDGCQFYFSGEFCPPHPSKEDLVQMVKYGGGKILSREPKSDVDKSLCLPTTRETYKVPNNAVTLAPIAYHANPSSKQYHCTQYVIYDSLAEKKSHIRNTVSSMPSTWLMDCASNFAILELE